jgi:uncharacterized protein YkwD
LNINKPLYFCGAKLAEGQSINPINMKFILSLALALFFCVVMVASPVTEAKHATPPVAGYTLSAGYGNMAADILAYVNEYRRKKGLSKLEMNSIMSAEAQTHSENMATHRTSFGHSGFQSRVKRITAKIEGMQAWAENVAMGSTTAKEVVENWLKSPMHRQNIEGPYNLTGIGVATDRKGNLYFTQIFGSN